MPKNIKALNNQDLRLPLLSAFYNCFLYNNINIYLVFEIYYPSLLILIK